MKHLTKINLLVILALLNLISLYFFVLGPISQIAYPLPGTGNERIEPTIGTYIVFLVILMGSVVYFIIYAKNEDVRNAIISRYNKDPKISAYKLQKILARDYPGIQMNTIKRILLKIKQ